MIESLALIRPRWLFEWAGGLIWLTCDADHITVRAVAESCSGHATLLRPTEKMRGSVPALHPQTAGVAALWRDHDETCAFAGIAATGLYVQDEGRT